MITEEGLKKLFDERSKPEAHIQFFGFSSPDKWANPDERDIRLDCQVSIDGIDSVAVHIVKRKTGRTAYYSLVRDYTYPIEAEGFLGQIMGAARIDIGELILSRLFALSVLTNKKIQVFYENTLRENPKQLRQFMVERAREDIAGYQERIDKTKHWIEGYLNKTQRAKAIKEGWL